jgi:hypothetical protein
MIYVNFYGWDEPKWYWRVYQYLVNLFSPKFVHVDIQLPLIKYDVVHGAKGMVGKNSGTEVLVTSVLELGVQMYDLDTPTRKPRETYMLAVDVESAWARIAPILGKKYSFYGYPTSVFNTPRRKTQGLSCVETVQTILAGCAGRDSAAVSALNEIRRCGAGTLTPSELRDILANCGVSRL